MDLNPLIAELNKNKAELIASIEIAIGLGELSESDVHVAHSLIEIKGKPMPENPFHEIAILYSLPINEVVKSIRNFINRTYKTFFEEIGVINDIEFKNQVGIN